MDQLQPEQIPTIPTTTEPKKKRTLPLNCRKKPGTLNRTTKKALSLCATTGIEPREALTLVNNGRIPAKETINNLKVNLDKYRLSHPRMVKLARNVVLETLKGNGRDNVTQAFSKTTGEVVDIVEHLSPSFTNQLAAAQMVYDRSDPVVHQALNINLNAEVSPVELGRWMNKRVDNPVDKAHIPPDNHTK
jgi:hypothetical protein